MSPQASPDPQFEALLDFLRINRGFDFSGYKRSSLMRRVIKRRQTLALNNFNDYQDYLQVHPEEFELLFNTILINVTSFFRDKPAWDYLTNEILPRIIQNKSDMEPIRVWSAGCASGEEAYTLAMAIAEYLGIEAFHRRVKIYATDVDNEALAQARLATYSQEDIHSVPEELRNKYFAHSNNGNFAFNPDLRRAVIFGLNDLVKDAPISRLDLLVCRNTLMYFNSEAQDRILSRFHFALINEGVLFLGKAEMLLTHADLFSGLDMKYRFFTKVASRYTGDNLVNLGVVREEQFSNQVGKMMRMRDLAFATAPEAELVIDINGVLLAVNEKAEKLFNLTIKDIGSPIYEMEICYTPVGLRPLIDRAIAENQPVLVPAVEKVTSSNASVFLDVNVVPLVDNGSHIIGLNVIYTDISRSKNLEEQLKESAAALETTNEELQSTNEELETTNEELQSTIEELETTNEELQATNEELETMNEELQSTNEELETINEELNTRTTELNISNSFQETILGNLKVGVVVIDHDFRITNWNSQAEELWGLRSGEIIGVSLLGLDIGLPVEKLKQPVRAVLDKKTDLEKMVLPAVNRRGKNINCHVTITPFMAGTRERHGAVLMMEVESTDKK